MSSETIYTPYCYLIGWSATNMFYYGRRTATGCSPEELMVSYHTSSSFVEEYIKIHGKPDIIQIRKTFDTAEEAAYWESTVLRRLKAAKHPRMLNHSNGDLNFDRTGYVSCIDNETGKSVSITTEEYRSNQDRYHHILKNQVIVVDKLDGSIKRITKEEYKANQDRYKSVSKDKVVIENIETKERSIVNTGTEIDRTTHRFITGKPIGTTESHKSRKLKAEAGRKKLTIRHNETKECVRVDREIALEMISTGTYSFVMNGLEKSEETRKLMSAGIAENAKVNRVCDINTRQEYSTAKFLAKDKIRENRLMRDKIERVCDILTKKEYSTHSFKVLLSTRARKLPSID